MGLLFVGEAVASRASGMGRVSGCCFRSPGLRLRDLLVRRTSRWPMSREAKLAVPPWSKGLVLERVQDNVATRRVLEASQVAAIGVSDDCSVAAIERARQQLADSSALASTE